MQRAFVIRPFGKKTDSAGKEIDFDKVDKDLITPALEALGMGGGTTGEIVEPGNIREDMFRLIIEADVVICDITVHNANVFYELGIRHALRKKRSILIKGTPVKDSTPFDILTDRYLSYEIDKPQRTLQRLVDMIRAALTSERETDSPIFKMLPALPEVDSETVHTVPQDFAEEVARASAAKSCGWLRLLAAEVQGRRFQWPAFRLIGQAQWAVGDYDGATATWALVRNNDPNDVAANLALANLYERQYRRDKKPELLTASNQAIARVLANARTSTSQRAEAFALEGRNTKTLWRLAFEELPDPATRRERAITPNLLKSYKSYRDAYLLDLNHFWSGLAALQVAAVAKSLSGDPAWEDIFETAREARFYAEEVQRQMEQLRASVGLAIQAALKRLPSGNERTWAEISRADLMFLNDKERPTRVKNTYVSAVPESDLFAWDATTSQLKLFARLGIRSDLANQVVNALDAKFKPPPAEPDLHLVIFAGHRIDAVGRTERRFPEASEPRARQLIRDRFKELKSASSRLQVLASAAPGSDILCHEICRELGISSTICLPMPVADFSGEVFRNHDAWRTRFLALVKDHAPLELSDRKGLPRWLEGTGINPWERGNRWVLEMALAGAPKVSLVALWDGKASGDGRGGTAHMVGIARESGTVDVTPIDARKLLIDVPIKPAS